MYIIIGLCILNMRSIPQKIYRLLGSSFKLEQKYSYYTLFVCFWRDSPQWARASSFTRLRDHTQRCTTVGRTLLKRVINSPQKSLLDNTHNTHNRQISMPHMGFFLTISAGEWQQTYTLDCAAIGIFNT